MYALTATLLVLLVMVHHHLIVLLAQVLETSTQLLVLTLVQGGFTTLRTNASVVTSLALLAMVDPSLIAFLAPGL